MSDNHETADNVVFAVCNTSELSELLKKAHVTSVSPIDKNERDGLFRVKFVEEGTSEESAEYSKMKARGNMFNRRGYGNKGDVDMLEVCLDYIEQYGDDKTERDIAIKKARAVHASVKARTNQIRDAYGEICKALNAMGAHEGLYGSDIPF